MPFDIDKNSLQPWPGVEYNNYVNMEGFYWSIELPDLTNYGLTSELKPEQKAEASIMARVSTVSEGHN